MRPAVSGAGGRRGRAGEAEPSEGAVGRHVAGAAAGRVDGGVVSREGVARAAGARRGVCVRGLSAARSEAAGDRAVPVSDRLVLLPAMPLGAPPARTCSRSGRSLPSGAKTWK